MFYVVEIMLYDVVASFFYVSAASLPPLPPPGHTSDVEGICNQVRKDGVLLLNSEDLTLEQTLGQGSFGIVKKGLLRYRRSQQIPVAVKELKASDMPSAEVSDSWDYM